MISSGMQLKRGINIYLLASQLKCLFSKKVKIQYLMLNNIYCIPEGKDSRKHILFIFNVQKMTKLTANATLK